MRRRRERVAGRLQEQRGIEAEVEVEDQVEIEVRVEVSTRVEVQAATRWKRQSGARREPREEERRGLRVKSKCKMQTARCRMAGTGGDRGGAFRESRGPVEGNGRSLRAKAKGQKPKRQNRSGRSQRAEVPRKGVKGKNRGLGVKESRIPVAGRGQFRIQIPGTRIQSAGFPKACPIAGQVA